MEIARLLYGAIGQHRVVSIAAGVTFFALLAMFPAVAALVSIYGIFADPGTIRVHLDDLSSVLPSGAIEVIGDQLTRVASGGKSTLGATFLFTLGLSLWSANAGMKALFDALNIVYDAQERRSLVKLNFVSLAFTGCALLVLLLAIAVIVVLPVALDYAGLQSLGGTFALVARWPGLYAIVAAGSRHRLPLWAGSRSRAVAMDYVGQCIGRGAVDRRVDPLLLVCRKFRRIQQNIRIARRRRRFHDLDVDLLHGDPRGSRS